MVEDLVPGLPPTSGQRPGTWACAWTLLYEVELPVPATREGHAGARRLVALPASLSAPRLGRGARQLNAKKPRSQKASRGRNSPLELGNCELRKCCSEVTLRVTSL